MSSEIVTIIDTSRWSGRVEWDLVKEAGVEGIYNRCTLGDWYADPTYDLNTRKVSELGFDIGGYHVLNFKQDPIYQAELFVANLKTTNLVPVLDCERYQWSQRARNWDAIQIFDMIVLQELGVHCMFYTRGYWWDRYIGNQPDMLEYLLWVAHYNDRIEHPRLPKAWHLYTLWQYSDKGRIPGIASATDLNRFGTDPRSILME